MKYISSTPAKEPINKVLLRTPEPEIKSKPPESPRILDAQGQ